MLSGDPRKWSTPQKEHVEGRTRPACACRTDNAGSDRKLDLLSREIPRRRAGRRSARRPVPACRRIWSAPLT